MSGFEVYFSFYGLLLGLSLAQIANGVGHAVIERKTAHIGWLTPLLAAFLLLDIASFWLWAWGARDVIDVSYATINTGLVIALAYYIAAVLLFPVDRERWRDLDLHYWDNKRFVIIGVVVANSIVVGHGVATRPELLESMRFWILQPLYWVPLALILFSRRKAIDVGALSLLITMFLLLTIGDMLAAPLT